MERIFLKLLKGYKLFRDKYVHADHNVMDQLAKNGQQPEIMVIACSDSRVDPALLLQCDPGDLFVVRNVANIVPPYENDDMHHGTSAALEFGVCKLKVKHLILLGHSHCGGIKALLERKIIKKNDFISKWVSIIEPTEIVNDVDHCAKLALNKSLQNCLTFPWIQDRVNAVQLKIHLWFFDIKKTQIFSYCNKQQEYIPLDIAVSEQSL